MNSTESKKRFWPSCLKILLGLALIAGVLCVAPSGVLHSVDFSSFAKQRESLNDVAELTYLLLAFSLSFLLYRCRRALELNWVSVCFSVFLFAETLNRTVDLSLFGLGSFSSHYGDTLMWLVNLLAIIGSCAALLTIGGLPNTVRRISSIIQKAAKADGAQLQLTATIESSLSAILMLEPVRTETGRIVDLRFRGGNRKAEDLLRTSREALDGKCLDKIFPELMSEACLELYQNVISSGEAGELQFSCQQSEPAGEEIHYRLQAAKVEQGIVLTLTDVSQSRRSQEELEQALEHKRAIVACSPFCTIVTDQHGDITSVNPAAERMLLYTHDELIGQNITMLHDAKALQHRAKHLSREIGCEVSPDFRVLTTLADMGVTDEREWACVRKDGTRLPVQLSVSALKKTSGGVIGYVGVSYDLTDRKRAEAAARTAAHLDPLTGLPNRELLRDRLQVSIERAKRSGEQLGIIMIDLDNFKRVNDSLGHPAGDALLREATRRLQDAVRKSDTVARMGGDEFVVVLSDLHNSEDAKNIALKLLDEISKPIRLESHEVTVTASLGVSLYPEAEDIDALFKNADMAMYRAKGRGRNNVEIYTPGLGMESLKKLEMESALRTALKTNGFEIVYQPQIAFSGNRMIGVEALLRWESAEFGNVPPSTFIPIAEETGFIVALGEWVLNTACRQIAALQLEIGRKLCLAVNISPRQFQQKNFPETVERALRISGLDPSQLELEITEQLLMVDSEESLETMKRVRRLGVKFAIDDFGTGFSNMAYITRFAVDRIKIDRSFISKCDADTNSKVVTSAIIALAHSLDIEVIAEGVETSSHVSTLQDMNCDSAQGYLYARPLKLGALKSYATRLPSIPRRIEAKSGIRLAFTNINTDVMQIAS